MMESSASAEVKVATASTVEVRFAEDGAGLGKREDGGLLTLVSDKARRLFLLLDGGRGGFLLGMGVGFVALLITDWEERLLLLIRVRGGFDEDDGLEGGVMASAATNNKSLLSGASTYKFWHLSGSGLGEVRVMPLEKAKVEAVGGLSIEAGNTMGGTLTMSLVLGERLLSGLGGGIGGRLHGLPGRDTGVWISSSSTSTAGGPPRSPLGGRGGGGG